MPDFAPVDISRIQYIAVAVSILLIVSILVLIRRGKLREEYALIGLGSSLGATALLVRDAGELST